eukprot:PhF_6_TR35073/c1_g1_i1/m.51112
MIKALARLLLHLKERGLVPDYLIRLLLRWMCWFWVRRLSCYGDVEKQNQYLLHFVKKLKGSETAIKQKEANEQHYEVPTSFFKTCLGPSMKYSCGLWDKHTHTLEQSETAMMKLACERARIHDEGPLRVLDLGCGWGSMSIYIAKNFPRSTVTALSNSRTQKEFIDSRAKELGLTNITVITADASVFDFESAALFDRIVTNEMLEHMKNYDVMFAKMGKWLAPGGYLFIHILGNRRFAYNFGGGEDDWMGKYFFSGGTMPSENLFSFFLPPTLRIDSLWRVNGTHYAKTLNAWLKQVDEKKEHESSPRGLEGCPPRGVHSISSMEDFLLVLCRSIRLRQRLRVDGIPLLISENLTT